MKRIFNKCWKLDRVSKTDKIFRIRDSKKPFRVTMEFLEEKQKS